MPVLDGINRILVEMRHVHIGNNLSIQYNKPVAPHLSRFFVLTPGLFLIQFRMDLGANELSLLTLNPVLHLLV